MVLKPLVEHVLRPALSRLGTAAAALLIALGADASLAGQVATGATALVLIGVDLTLSYFNRKRAVKREGDPAKTNAGLY